MTQSTRLVTASQLRAARALIGISGEELAARTNLGLRTIRRAENEDGLEKLTPANAQLLISTLEELGVQFLDADQNGGVGVRFASKASRKRKVTPT